MDVEKMAEAVFANVRAFVLRSLEPITGRLAAIEAAHAELKALPIPKDGTSIGIEDVLPALTEQVKAHLDALPVPTNGKSVTVEEVVAALLPKLDGLQAQWALDFERRAQGVLERAAERIPKPKDGIDAFSLDDFDARLDPDGRTVMLSFTQGDRQVHKHLAFPVVIDKGFWKDGFLAEKGDGVTFGGSYWIAQKDTETKPDIGNPDWRLAVKKGRDGKDFTK